MDSNVIIKPASMPKAMLWAALAVILLGQFVVTIDLTVLNIALPDLTQDLKPTSDQLLWIVDSYSLVLAGLIVAASSLSDRFGRKRMLLAGFLIFGAASAGVLFVESAEQLIALRALLGIGGAAIMPITIAMIRSIFSDSRERAAAIAVWSAVSALGMAFGPLIGGLLLDSFSWHSAFLLNVPLMAIAFVAGMFILPEVKLKNPGGFDALGSIVFLVGMVGLLWGIKHVAAELEFDRSGTIALAIGIAFIGLFIIRCLKAKHPLVDFSLFKSRIFSAGVVATLFSTFAMAVLLYLLAQWFQLVNGDNPLEAGLNLVPMAIASLAGSIGAPLLAQKTNPRNVVAGGLAVAAIGMLVLVAFADDLSLGPIIASTCFVGLGSGALALGATLMMQETPAEKASSAGSLQEVSYDMGNVFGVAILGSVASIIYRENLSASKLTSLGLDNASIDLCGQSFAVTAEIASQTGIKKIFDLGSTAFNESIIATAAIGAVLTLAIAVTVWLLIPKSASIIDADDLSATDTIDASSPKAGETNQASIDQAASVTNHGVQVDDKEIAVEEAPTEESDAGTIGVGKTSSEKTSGTEQPSMHPASTGKLRDTRTETVSEQDAPSENNPSRDALLSRIDADTLRDLDSICQELGIDASCAFSLFAKKVVHERRIPFELSLINGRR